ncbi:MAG TPA: TetR/AcrR family transcriptional regulator [Spirochaetota bacterium]|nr:TetR/AcrR family transcriptional regulator [Spirochaetota bacterium]HOD15937.1 TetR/AcrR family transcriptional regulator [Spirochaetota bacterium]HPG52249.1 TetR/AcrR family transcriptional regulator [Spirochaetota bacterium]HPN11353.1 TetR/AcrR family transcriptional regulator [Spirochaetota bacterium]HQL81303.1 TetR/AcrR family transcriptional regulator [Spirochaetota bacterium]
MTKKEPKTKRISDILDASIQEFVEKGYENTTMESIAARAGLTKGGLYYHFNSKDDILVKANETFMEPIFLFMGEAMADPDPARGLAGYIRNYLSYWTGHPRELSFVFLTMIKTMASEQFRHLYRGYTTQMTDFFNTIYLTGITSKRFRSFNTRSASLALMAALDGIIGYLIIDAELVLEQTIEDFTETFITTYKER